MRANISLQSDQRRRPHGIQGTLNTKAPPHGKMKPSSALGAPLHNISDISDDEVEEEASTNDPVVEFLGAMSADSSGDEDDPLHKLVQSLPQEDRVGPDLDSKLQKMVQLGMRLDTKKMKDKEEAAKFLRP